MNEASLRESPASVLVAWFGALAVAALLAYGWLFVTGWSYAHYYFSHFGIGLSTLQPALNSFAPYGYLVFKAWWIPFLAAWILLVGGLVGFRASLQHWSPVLRMGAGLPLLLLLFAIGPSLAKHQARQVHAAQQSDGFSAFPGIEIQLDAHGDAAPANEAQAPAAEAKCSRLLFASPRRLFVFHPPSTADKATVPKVTVIPLRNVTMYRLLPGEENCGAGTSGLTLFK